MRDEWKTERLSALCEQIADCPHSTPLWTESGELVLRSQNIRNGRLDLSVKSYTDEAHFEQRSRRARLRGGDLVITREAPMGEVCLIPDGLRCCLGQRMVMLRPDPKKCDSRFLLYSIQSRAVQDEIKVNEGTGSTVSNLRIPLLEALPIPHPPLAEQKAIAAVLGALDDKIDLNRRMNATLEAMAQALFQSWFVDFDPVRAQLDDCERPRMDRETARLFPSHFSQSELGMIPQGWAVAPFSEVFKIPLRNGLTRPKGVRGAGTRMVNMGELFSHRRIGNIEMDRVPLEGEELSRNLLETGDLLFARQSLTLAGAGQCSIIVEANEARTFESHLIRCRLDSQKSNCWFFFYYFLSAQGRARVVSIVEQVAAAGIRGSDLARMKVLTPPMELQRRFGEAIAPLEMRIAANSDQSRTLATLRDTLLPKLLSGELSLAVANHQIT